MPSLHLQTPRGTTKGLMKKSPLQTVKEKFNDKESLIKAVQTLASGDLWIDRLGAAKSLSLTSNAKLLKLHETLGIIKKDFGSRKALIAEIQKIAKREKDAAWTVVLEKSSTPKLYDMFTSLKKKAAPKRKAA